MRVRRVYTEKAGRVIDLNFCSERGAIRDIIGIVGDNGSGKTTLLESISHIWQCSLENRLKRVFLFDKAIGASIDFEVGGAITTGVFQGSEIKQNVITRVSYSSGGIQNGILYYGTFSRSMESVYRHGDSEGRFGSGKGYSFNIVSLLLRDFYSGDIRDSVILIDDFDLGLSFSSARKLLQLLIRKSLEKNNQLIVTTVHEEVLEGIGEGSLFQLPSSTDLIDTVVKECVRK